MYYTLPAPPVSQEWTRVDTNKQEMSLDEAGFRMSFCLNFYSLTPMFFVDHKPEKGSQTVLR